MTSFVPPRIVIVCPTLLDRDAVGGATARLYRDLAARPDWITTVITRRNDRVDIPAELVSSLGEMLISPTFRSADLIIYIFAIHNELFDAMLIGNGRAQQTVRFHNVTPKAHVEPKDYDVIDRSIDQLRNFDSVDEVWADSPENRHELERRAIASGKIQVLPLSVQPLVRATLTAKPIDTLNLLYVGRFVPSKGLHDLIEALAAMRRLSDVAFHSRMVGNLRHAPADYVAHLRGLISLHALEGQVEIEGPVEEASLAAAYRWAHMLTTASRHEGFCLPVIEGLAAGCVPVTYRNSNLRDISGGLGRLADEDTPDSLATAMIDIAVALSRGEPLPLTRGPTSTKTFDIVAADYVAEFHPATCEARVQGRVVALLKKNSRSAAGTSMSAESTSVALASHGKESY